jgi:Uma2 family endonuclease
MTSTTLETIELSRAQEPILISELTWREFKVIEQLIDRPGIRLSFFDGVLEIRKMPGRTHETAKKRLAALIEIYLEFLGLDYTPTGSMTLESEVEQVKREADESYEFAPNREHPDLAIEIVVTSGGINKLAAYQRLQICEVWFWERENLAIYVLQVDGYQQVERSHLLPDLNLDFLVSCMNLSNHLQAVKEFRQSLQEIK